MELDLPSDALKINIRKRLHLHDTGELGLLDEDLVVRAHVEEVILTS